MKNVCESGCMIQMLLCLLAEGEFLVERLSVECCGFQSTLVEHGIRREILAVTSIGPGSSEGREVGVVIRIVMVLWGARVSLSKKWTV
jgi:hypothetical protein